MRSKALALALMLAACGQAGDPGTRTTTTEREVSVGGIVTTRSKTTTTEPAADASEAPMPAANAGRGNRAVQSGILTAGDYDDILNPALYAAYASRALQALGEKALPFVDTRTRITLKIVDAAGRPVPQARISIARASGQPLQLVSAADGVASFYPAFDGIGQNPAVKIASDAGALTRTLQLGKKGEQSVTLTLPGAGRPVGAMDLVIMLDTTGSMGDEMAYLKAELDGEASRVFWRLCSLTHAAISRGLQAA